ncbi:hypothetical protein CK247_30295, partial [Klebsiella pneumoniae]
MFLIILNSDFGCCSPSMIQSALKILWRQCSHRGIIFIGRQHVVRRFFKVFLIILNSDFGCCSP